jgi:trk system potassium uptake protein TrkA
MKSFLILGLGRFGKSLAKSLFETGHEVMVVDNDIDNIQNFNSQVTHAISADITSENFLKSIDVDKFDAVIVAIGSNIQVSILTTVILKELGAKYILVKAQDDFEEKILYKVGADKVIQPESDMGAKVALNLSSNRFLETIEISPEYSIITMSVPRSWAGSTIGKLSIRKSFNVNIIAIKEADDKIFMPDADMVLDKDMTLTLMGSNSSLKKVNMVK